MPIAKLRDSSCSVSRSLSVLGERWTLLILRLAFEGETRFDAFRGNLGVAADVLADRLSTLVEHGIMTKDPYQDAGSRARFEYHLTPTGRELHVIIAGLQQWGDTHLPWEGGPTVVRQRHETDAPIRVAFVDDSGCEVPLDEVDAVRTASYPR
ncbi:winged helix-turn-helix transcriptional regulator [Actinoplanes awajinensis]|uniref:HxlR family transcriptional regulator n=1 Tax=Actinoplanes awajinensis subsp. mycoplanecinus TaxID=135947 RepID=A0A101JMW4_9ACTN|nr:helix-turn-helix domain-containing protein [Actinoplanes awajinensis]KUL29746.1 HxlR family transcriptional regulator [Actinoplanes awajinensis subsp. mycoplanecinus]